MKEWKEKLTQRAQQQEKCVWYPLDNAANIYPVIQNASWTSMFRYTVLLREAVDRQALQAALDKMRPRFIGFYVRLKRGVFWYYLEQVDTRALVGQDTLSPCPPLSKDELPFRIKVHNNRIAAEFSHIICDGGGGLVFFQTLLAQYFRERGITVPVQDGMLELSDPPRPEEMTDDFGRFARAGARPNRQEPRAYKLVGTPLLSGLRCVTTGVLSVEKALELARKHKVTLTEYMTATLIFVLYSLQKAEYPHGRLKPVKVSVPVNLRKYYDAATLRNFSQYLNPGIDANYGDFTFQETLDQVHHYFRYMFTEKNLNARLSQNVDAARNPVLRIVPLFIKRWSIRLVYEMTGETVYSSVLSNVGALKVPDVMRDEIERCDLLLCTAKRNAVECAMMSYEDKLSVTFTRSIAEPYVERMFFRALVEQGLHVFVESNQLGEWNEGKES